MAPNEEQRPVGKSITQAHQLVGAVLKYAQRTGRVAKNVALKSRDEDLPNRPSASVAA
jgi:hypothetical protein